MDEYIEERLFDRAVSHSASPGDWEQLEALAGHDPGVWHRLALALRDHGDLVGAMAGVGEAADGVELVDVLSRRRRWGARAGWVAAAAAIAVWAGTGLFDGGLSQGRLDSSVGEAPSASVAQAPSDSAGEAPSASVAQAPSYSVGEAPSASTPASSQLVGELPSVLVGTRPLPDGEVEVTYLRRLLEKRTARRLYQPGTDEWGQPTAVPADHVTTWRQEL